MALPTARRFQDLVCWQLARELREALGNAVKTTPISRDFELCDQLRCAARSAAANIAEGFPCSSDTEFARFLEIAKRSLAEIENHLTECQDAAILTQDDATRLLNLTKRASVATSRLIKYLRLKSARRT